MERYLRIKFERHQRGWTQNDVAERTKIIGGLHRTMRQSEISAIERGVQIPTAAELDALARVFALSPASVLLTPCSIEDPEVQATPEHVV
ncbi:MAG TPA: helix-turn-helix transcriptional regulator [Vicinamibacterales bacterium]|nr:helix-turn-helix transcriptional regulator [Vicinamibacterales bacterium]